jgi:hypothetical protein
MAPVNSVRVTAVTEPTISFFAYILLFRALAILSLADSMEISCVNAGKLTAHFTRLSPAVF